MNKTESVKSKHDDAEKTQYAKNKSDGILWWMQKGRNSIYVKFLNNMHMI